MFDKERAIAEWRQRLASTGSLFEGDLDELESHLRDEIEALEEVDLRGQRAFDIAAEKLGDVAAIGLEFAKVNPLLVWRTALFWLATGCFLTLVGSPLWELSIHGAMDLGLWLHLPVWATKALVYGAILGGPPVIFGVFFAWASSRIGKPFKPLQRPWFRVALLCAGAVSMLGGHLHHMVVDRHEFRAFGGDTAYFEAQRAWSYGNWLLAFIAPAAFALFVLVLRRRAIGVASSTTTSSDREATRASHIETFRRREAPMFWLAVGSFIAIVRQELVGFVRGATVAVAGALHLGPERLATLIWIVAFACPLMLGLSMWTFLRFRAPSPHDLIKSPRLVLAIGLGCAMAIGGILSLEKTWMAARAGYDLSTFIDAFRTFDLANIFPALWIPVIIGTIMLRLERSAHGPTPEFAKF